MCRGDCDKSRKARKEGEKSEKSGIKITHELSQGIRNIKLLMKLGSRIPRYS